MKAIVCCITVMILVTGFSCKNMTESKSNGKSNLIVTAKTTANVTSSSNLLKQKPVPSEFIQAGSDSQNSILKDSAIRNTLTVISSIATKDNQLGKPFQEIRFLNKKDTLIKLQEGTSIRFPACAFVYEDDGTPVQGLITFLAKEFYKISDIILAGISTRTEKDILETGGMVYLEAKSDGRFCELAPGKSIEIRFLSNTKKENMQLFNGYPDADNKIIWRLAEGKEKKAPSEIFTVVEEQPEFPNGEDSLVKFLQENIKYPEEAIKLGVQGKVFVTFVVEEDGSFSDVRIVRGIGGGCDEEAIRLVKAMPKWLPGKQRGTPVRVQYNLPVMFILDKESRETNNGSRNSTPYTIGQEVRSNDTYSYLLRSGRLGWLNCDRILDFNNPKINVAITDENAKEVDMVMVFQRARVILAPSYIQDGKIVFERVPKNEKVILVSIKKKDNKLFLSMKEMITGEPRENNPDYKEVTPGELRIELRKLDR